MVFNIIMFVSCYPVLFIMLFVLLNDAEPKKNIVLGITVPASKLSDNRIVMYLKKYKKELKIYALIFSVIPFFSLLWKYMSIQYTVFMIWLLGVIGAMYVPYIKYRKKILIIKKKEKWYIKDTNKTLIDIKTINTQGVKKINNILFIPAMVISFVPIIIELFYPTMNGLHNSVLFSSSVFFAITIFIFFIKNIIYNQKVEVVCENSLVNETFTRVRKYNWIKCWSIFIYTNAIYEIVFFLFLRETIGMVLFVILTSIYSLVSLGAVMTAEITTRNVQQQISKEYYENFCGDDDSFWILGLIYYNKNDSKIMVNKRTGIGTTINMAKPIGKVIGVFILICILIIPLSCILMIKSEFTPITINVQDSMIIVKHTSVEEKIDIASIKSIDYMKEINVQNKINGTNMDNILKGTFNVEEFGRCELCLNPNIESFIVIKFNDKTYIINYRSEEDTKEMYNYISSKIYK